MILLNFNSLLQQQIGTELSPLDLFKLFHVRKNGIWASNKAKEMHETMESMRSTIGDQGLPVDEWKIYREVIGEPAHGHVIGWGAGIKDKDVYGSPSQGGNKHRCTDLEKKVKDLEKEVKKLKKIVKLVLGKSSTQASSQKDIVLTEEDENGDEDDQVEANDSEFEEVVLEDD
ncbi:uncharacterized protein LOC112499286 [Citrus sinensis]|uniref:uncharacterized protein LOC112499286 n=1 Tax=Citrus sinensis TaxID=2711 RepID=UPI0022791FBC|nr:uncharacterized protein LOC112499286 [Citrus sinensis]